VTGLDWRTTRRICDNADSAHRKSRCKRSTGEDAVFAAQEVVEPAVALKAGMRGEKLSLQRMKEKILRLVTEIHDRSNLEAKVQMTPDAAGIIREQNAIDFQVLAEYNRKNADQTISAE
jgi:hypothetical protein